MPSRLRQILQDGYAGVVRIEDARRNPWHWQFSLGLDNSLPRSVVERSRHSYPCAATNFVIVPSPRQFATVIDRVVSRYDCHGGEKDSANRQHGEISAILFSARNRR